MADARSILVLEGARRDALWGLLNPTTGELTGARIVDRGAAERLASAVAAAAPAAALSAIIVGIGPGSFTGIRIVLAFAKGLALARRLPIVGIDSLQAMQLELDEPCVAILEAYAGQVFARGPELPTDCYDPAVVREHLQRWPGVCDGPVPSLPGAALLDVHERQVAKGLARLGKARLDAQDFDDAATLGANYARPSTPEMRLAERK